MFRHVITVSCHIVRYIEKNLFEKIVLIQNKRKQRTICPDACPDVTNDAETYERMSISFTASNRLAVHVIRTLQICLIKISGGWFMV